DPKISIGMRLAITFKPTVTETSKPTPEPEEKGEQLQQEETFAMEPTSGISVAMKIKKRLTLLAMNNNTELPIYGITVKSSDGSIRFVKALGWDRDKLDSSTVIVQTDDRPITKGHNKIVLLLLDPSLGIEWKALDENGAEVASGAMIPQ
ncbi:MAG: hypothetical protein ACE5KA_09395, partial [Nitrososphaerales archaeon]